MTRDFTKTLAFVAVAVIMTGAAFLNIPDRSRRDAEFLELGTKFFPDFVDPASCASLEVVDYDTDTAMILPFKVQLKDGKWTIPSHSNYPADGKDRLVKTSTGFIDLTRDTLRSESVDDHEKFGVVDPLDKKSATLKGKGKRVTLKDASDKILADLIIGKEVGKERPGQRFVRRPDDKRTYGVNMNVDLSTRFADWIETNLLKVEVAKVQKVDFDGHKVDPDRRVLVPGEILKIERKDASSPWNLVNATVPTGKELDTEKLLALVTALGDVKIVGVRPKPNGLSRDLKAAGDVKRFDPIAARSLVAKGFYPTPDGFYSNEGDIIVSTEDGAVYTLRFGEVFVGSGEALSAGVEEDKAVDPSKKAEKKPEGAESRYLLVTVAFDPKLLPALPDPDADKPLDLPADVFHREPGSPEKLAQEKVVNEKAEKRKAEVDKQRTTAEKKVKDLSDRFAAWYYLTPNDSFRSLALNRTTLIREKSAQPAPSPEGPAGFPGLPPGGFPGMGGRPGAPRSGRPANPHGPN